MAQAFRVQYTGSNATATMYIQDSTLYLVDSTTTTFDLTNASYDTLTELATAINALTYHTCTLLGTASASSTSLNEISYDYKADIKTQAYIAGYNNYTSPKKLCALIRRNADKILQSWFDEADAYIENMTGYVFRSTTLSSTNLNVSEKDIFTNEEYAYLYQPCNNALIIHDYTPVTTLTTLTVDGTSVTTSYVIVDHDTLTLSSDAETTYFVPGRAKVTIALTYGYATTTKEGILASDYATFYIISKYFIKELMDAKLTGGTIKYGDTVNIQEISDEGITRQEISKRMADIELMLPTKKVYAIG